MYCIIKCIDITTIKHNTVNIKVCSRQTIIWKKCLINKNSNYVLIKSNKRVSFLRIEVNCDIANFSVLQSTHLVQNCILFDKIISSKNAKYKLIKLFTSP